MIACVVSFVFTEQLKKLEEKTGYPKVYLFGGSVLVLSAVLTLLGGAKLFVDLLGFVYPAYMSFKCMDSGSNADNGSTQWLTYWVIFSFASIMEGLLGFIVSLIPFYFWLKVAFIVYLWHPSTRGAQMAYDQILRPILMPYLDSDKTTKKNE